MPSRRREAGTSPGCQTRKAEAGERAIVLFLHAHLPDCRRPGQPASIEETWFFEALTETYLPLVRLLDRLACDQVDARLTISFSPTLLCMLRDTALLERYVRRVDRTIDLAQDDAQSAPKELREVAAWHAVSLAGVRRLFAERCRGDILAVFRGFLEAGAIELATTAATHAFLPAYQQSPSIVRAQVGVGLDTFASAFGSCPAFFWLPECGYFPGLEDLLASFDLKGFAVESHALTQGQPPASDVHRLVRCPNGLAVFARDPGLSAKVWSAQHGYPGHPDYREFHRDRVHQLPREAIIHWLDGSEERLPSGLKYWRVTGPGEAKDVYDPAAGSARALEHARDFVDTLSRSQPGGLCFLPFDAELFGHWWHEGPEWLENVLRLAATSPALSATTVSEAMASRRPVHRAQPAASTWGHRGDNSFWVSHDTAWIYPRLIDAAERLEKHVGRLEAGSRDKLCRRTIRQAARTLLLAQASDWPFMISAGTAAGAARDRLSELIGALDRLLQMLDSRRPDAAALQDLEARFPAFPNLDLDRFGGHHAPAKRRRAGRAC